MYIPKFILLIIVASWMVTSGCTRIQEPWVQNDEPLKQERFRSAEQQKELRERLAETQRDR